MENFSNISSDELKEEVKPMEKENESGMVCIYNNNFMKSLLVMYVDGFMNDSS